MKTRLIIHFALVIAIGKASAQQTVTISFKINKTYADSLFANVIRHYQNNVEYYDSVPNPAYRVLPDSVVNTTPKLIKNPKTPQQVFQDFTIQFWKEIFLYQERRKSNSNVTIPTNLFINN